MSSDVYAIPASDFPGARTSFRVACVPRDLGTMGILIDSIAGGRIVWTTQHDPTIPFREENAHVFCGFRHAQARHVAGAQ